MLTAYSITSLSVMTIELDGNWVDYFVEERERITIDEYSRFWGKNNWNDREATHILNQESNEWIMTNHRESEDQKQDESQSTDRGLNGDEVGSRLEEFQRRGAI